MNILIQDYSTTVSSQARLLYAESQKNNNINTYFYSQGGPSIYDTIDSTSPDYIITHAFVVSPDLVHYLTYNNIGKIIVLNIPEDISPEDYEKITDSSFFKQHVFLTVGGKKQHKGVRNVNLNPCVDTNIPSVKMKHNIPLAIILGSDPISPTLMNLEKSYHCISFADNQSADIKGANISLAGLYGNYDKIIFENISRFDQPFFDALYRSQEVYFTSNDKKLCEASEKLFGYNLELNSKADFDKIKKTIQEKHLPCHRLKTLLSQMSIDQSLFMEVNK